ncbi:mitochondrial basic amino acids transporter [Drosophila sulfurigaster albostrigata]|uniref:mitochondrial basic amino acids transporter n=1 Tax=Drosophila sulfurigaster albostrigata TaxID=89887 RepID=UPI002D21C16C|nr:mitochondrial basic amino acids transporter [Drosophila sulfurigaster albostrigata]XP_062121385.1 mitochondrial basic amino acids transporter [Drosophila sulfurigaster albostrigata]XP_062121386.1 mitochondrial basic amino acids transporter [Drosophila sulfurigaster albostrigata]
MDFIAGLFGGAAGVLVGHPFDTVKVHLQTDNPNNPKYRGTFHCMKSILLSDNIRGLYRGISSPMMGIGLVNAIVFGVYGNVQRLSDNPNSLASHFWAGAAGGLVQSIVCAPMELAKTRLQLANHIDSSHKFKGPIDCLMYIYRTEGIRGCFKGFTATILRDIPGFSSYFVSYEFLMQCNQTPGVFYTLMAGGFAGVASWLACYPVDVIKTHLQADALGKHAKYNGFVDCAVKSYEREGYMFFFRGLNSTLIRAFPMNAACFFVVSWILDFCKRNGIDMIDNSNQSFNVVNLENWSPSYLDSDIQSDDKLVRKLISDRVVELQLLRESPYETLNGDISDYYHRDHIYETKVNQIESSQFNINGDSKRL